MTHAALALPGASSSTGQPAQIVEVFYAGSLVNAMEREIGPAFEKSTGDAFHGYAGGSNLLAGQIKGKLKQGDVFISANPKVDASLMGPANDSWVSWYVSFAESPLVVGYTASSRFAADFKAKAWYEVLSEPGIRIGRTDPKLDPKGALTVQLMDSAGDFYQRPGLARTVLGATDNPAQVLPEETLLGRLESGQLDAGFFYTTEVVNAKIASVTLPAQITPKAIYTVTILRDAPHPAAAQRFVAFLLGSSGLKLLEQRGLTLRPPSMTGDPESAPPDIRALTAASP